MTGPTKTTKLQSQKNGTARTTGQTALWRLWDGNTMKTTEMMELLRMGTTDITLTESKKLREDDTKGTIRPTIP